MDEEMNMWNCRYSAKWRNGGGDNWCSTVDGNSGCHLLTSVSSEDCLERHIADIKNIAGTTWIPFFKQNSTAILESFEIYIYEIVTDASQLMEMAAAMGTRVATHPV